MNGRVIGISGPTLIVQLDGARMYDQVLVGPAQIAGEIVRLDGGQAVVQLYGETRGIALGTVVTSTGHPLELRLGPGMLGGICDGLQRPLDALLAIEGAFLGIARPGADERRWSFLPIQVAGSEVQPGTLLGEVPEGPFAHRILAERSGRIMELDRGDYAGQDVIGRYADGTPIRLFSTSPARTPRPVRQKLPPREPLITGQRAIDFLFPIARGGTAIFPGGFGTGKTVLEQALARFAAADVVIYIGCGERGNEMAEMLEEFTTLEDPWTRRPLRERTVTIVNTSNMPVAAREASIYTGVTLAEYYRDMGCHVLLLADSLSRWAEALREISSALEEMPGEEGYPTYLNSRLASFMARAGEVETLGGAFGSLSMVLSVSPPGGDFTEPVTQACLRNAGTFLMLDTALAHRRHFPAIHWFQSYSLYDCCVAHFTATVAGDWCELRQRTQHLLRREEELREVAEIVGEAGLQEEDRLIMMSAARIREQFLAQNAFTEDAFTPPESLLAQIRSLLAEHDRQLLKIRGDTSAARGGSA